MPTIIKGGHQHDCYVITDDVTKSYQSGPSSFKALDNISLTADKGDIVVILGPSGSGKSTLLNAIGGIDTVDHGKIVVQQSDITQYTTRQLVDYRRDHIGFVFQMYNLIPNLTVYENIELTANLSRSSLSIQDVITSVGLSGKADRFPAALSGGEQQRVSIARAVVKTPSLLLCDEPTGALDSETSKDILQLIQYVNETYETTVMIITHNQAISDMAHRTIMLKDGQINSTEDNPHPLKAERMTW